MKLHVKNKHEFSQIDGIITMTEIATQEVSVQKDFSFKKQDLVQSITLDLYFQSNNLVPNF